MQFCSAGDAPMMKGDKLSEKQCPRNDLKRKQMKDIPFSLRLQIMLYGCEISSQDLVLLTQLPGR